MNITYYLKIVYRNFINQRPYSFLNLIGLSIGLCISFIALLYVTEETGYDTFHENSNNIYRLINKDSKGSLFSINSPQISNVFKEKIPEIKKRVYYFRGVFKVNDVVENENCFYADPDVVDIFTFNSVVGNLNAFKNNPKNIIISRAFALKYFKTEDVINNVVELESREGKEVFTIVAVFNNFYRKSTFKPNLIVQNINSRNYKNMLESNNMGSKGGQSFLLLESKAEIKSVITKMNKVFSNQKTHFSDIYDLQPLQKVHLYSENIFGSQSGAITRLMSYTVIGVLILIISLINFLLLYTAIAKRRMKEFAIREVNGLGKGGLIKMILFELMCISLISGFIAVVLLKFVVPIFNEFTQSDLVLDWSSNIVFLVYAAGLIFAIGIITTVYFYNNLTKYNAIEIIAKENLKSKKNPFLKNGVHTIQLIVVFVMLTFSLFYYKQLDFMINTGKGFTTEDLFLLNKIDWDSSSFEEELTNYPVIRTLAKGTILPLHGSSTQYTINLKDEPSESFGMELFRVDSNYLSLYEIILTEGRDFSKETVADTKGETILINESAAKLLGGKNLIGKETNQGKIIGIVEDFKFESFYNSLRPLFLRYPKTFSGEFGDHLKKNEQILIKYKKGQKENASELIYKLLKSYNVNVLKNRKEYHKLIKRNESNIVFDINYYDSLVKDIYNKDIVLQKAILLLTVIAIFITILGLIGMSLFKTQQKTKEIGIRKVNGATINEILFMLNQDFIKWVFIAFVIACPIAYYAMSKWLENFAYKTSLSWWVFALAGVFTLVIAMLTVSWQSYRAATRNPVESLRDE